MNRPQTRRRLLSAAGGFTAATVLADPILAAQAQTRRRAPLARGGKFDLGVMSGDPKPNAVTLWTRLGEMEADRVSVRLEIARDADFRRVVARQLVPTARDRDHTVKVRVGKLAPDERYWFRFSTRGAASEAGRFQTAPAADSLRPLRFGVFSCQDYVSGYYGAYQRFLEEDCDFVLCLGDYMYERIFYPVFRKDETGANRDGEVKTLDEYRAKYRLYRSDPDLRAMHREIPFLAMWDDHEVEDNYAGGDPYSDDYDRPRTLAGWQAFHEYQPNLKFIEQHRTYRRLRFGGLAELFLTDQRSYRTDQPCGDAFIATCDDSPRPRDYLGRQQMDWLKDRLHRSKAAWKIIGNQLMIMPFDLAAGIPVVQDSWEGYQAERNELLQHVFDRGIEDVAFVTGDIHTFFAGDVLLGGRGGPPVATEFVAGSTTSPGTAAQIAEIAGLPEDTVRALTDLLPVTNPWFRYAETRSHGVAICELDANELRVVYWASRDITTSAGSRDLRRLRSFAVQRGVPRVQLR